VVGREFPRDERFNLHAGDPDQSEYLGVQLDFHRVLRLECLDELVVEPDTLQDDGQLSVVKRVTRDKVVEPLEDDESTERQDVGLNLVLFEFERQHAVEEEDDQHVHHQASLNDLLGLKFAGHQVAHGGANVDQRVAHDQRNLALCALVFDVVHADVLLRLVLQTRDQHDPVQDQLDYLHAAFHWSHCTRVAVPQLEQPQGIAPIRQDSEALSREQHAFHPLVDEDAGRDVLEPQAEEHA